MPDDKPIKNRDAQRSRKLHVGERVTIDGVAGIVYRPGRMIDAKGLRDNPAFDPNYESEQGRYNGPLWKPLDEG